MKKSIIKYLTVGAIGLLSAVSCTDYLDKSPDTDVDPGLAFRDFTSFQGFVEQIYTCIPNKQSCQYCTSFNWGDDEIMNTTSGGNSHITNHFDLGDYKWWYLNNQSFLRGSGNNVKGKAAFDHSMEQAWYCIRIANLGIKNIDLLSPSTSTEERNAILGQLYFFRAWWHQEMMAFFGGIPYIEEAYEGEIPFIDRMSFRECAEKAAADFRKAADLLPNNWDTSAAGSRTKGHNAMRITKVCALGYLGKMLLWAASPLHEHGAQVGALANGKTYQYNTELAKQAADALAEAISYVEKGETPYELAVFAGNYKEVTEWGGKSDRGIYDHSVIDNENSYTGIFYTTGQNWKVPGGKEAIMRGPAQQNDETNSNHSNWNFSKLWGPKVNELVQHDAVIHLPTANYVNYAYGMENGLPITDPDSGFDPSHPFQNRDPRFYHDIVFDGFRFINGDPEPENEVYQYLPLQSPNGTDPAAELMRDPELGSRTGYFCQKLVGHQCNKYDKMYDWGGAFASYLSYMRLADIYLMFAEAGAAAKGADFTSSKWSGTAADAINTLRDRVGAGHVADKYLGDAKKFMDEVRRERACELAFEGMRWYDLQRWLLLTEYPYNVKTSQEFRRVGNYDFANNDPRFAEVTGWHEEEILTRALEVKHYFLPFKDEDVYLYDGFKQNPGW